MPIRRATYTIGVLEKRAGVPVAPVPDDLAVDGVDELLKAFVAYAFSQWPEDFTAALRNSPGRTFLIQAEATPDSGQATGNPATSWRVTTAPARLTVEGGPGQEPADAAAPDVTISGSPATILRWAWNRETPGEPSPVRIEGNAEALAEFRQCVVEATQ